MERDVKILIEPLPKNSTDVINTLEEAMKIVNSINHPAISTMFDFHNTLDETEPLPELHCEVFQEYRPCPCPKYGRHPDKI
jgi:sugar phosphate isomerase/epimerase